MENCGHSVSNRFHDTIIDHILKIGSIRTRVLVNPRGRRIMYMDSFIYIYEGVCTGSITKVRSNTAMETIVQQLLSNRAKRPGNATEQSVPLLGSIVGGSAVVEMEKNSYGSFSSPSGCI